MFSPEALPMRSLTPHPKKYFENELEVQPDTQTHGLLLGNLHTIISVKKDGVPAIWL